MATTVKANVAVARADLGAAYISGTLMSLLFSLSKRVCVLNGCLVAQLFLILNFAWRIMKFQCELSNVLHVCSLTAINPAERYGTLYFFAS